MREDRARKYSEMLTVAVTPTVDGMGKPNGGETFNIANIRTMSRQHVNNAGQVEKSHRFFDFTGITYDPATPMPGTPNLNYYETDVGYDHRGRPSRTKTPTGTIERMVYDGLGRVVSTWIGTNDTVSGEWSPANPGQMLQITASQYDNGGTGDSNLTRYIEYPTTRPAGPTEPADARVTRHFYDWRNRLYSTKSGVMINSSGGDTPGSEAETVNRQIIHREYDNLDRVTAVEQYDGDTVTITFTNGIPDKPAQTRRRARTSTSFDVQGRVWRTETSFVAQVTGGGLTVGQAGNTLKTDFWYDKRGNVIKTSAPGGLVTKNQYDGAGRVTKLFQSDGGGDTSWTDAGNVAGDKVLEQSEYTYDGNSNVILVTTRQRFHDETLTGELSDRTGTAPPYSPGNPGPKARVSFVANYYDTADRLTHVVNVGSNFGTAFNRPTNPPGRGDAVLITQYAYNDAGWIDTTTDPRGILAKTTYDRAGRETKIIEGYVDGIASPNDDRTTEYKYDGMDHLLELRAILPAGGPAPYQITKWVYGVVKDVDGNDLTSNDVVKEVRYPDKGNGEASSLSTHIEKLAYNAVGQVKTRTDRNGSKHEYDFDPLGRVTADKVTVLGSGSGWAVDGAIRRLGSEFDEVGRPFRFTSYNAATGGTVVNDVKRTFNGLGQLIQEQQDHNTSVSGSSPKVQYAYSFIPTGSGVNHSRMVSMTYPNNRVISYNYLGTDNTISRLTEIKQDTTTLEGYTYLGLGTLVKRAHPAPSLDLTYIHATAGGDSNDKYQGLDRFGRVVEQWWVRAGADRDRFKYRYDRNGNRLYRQNLLQPDYTELYHANQADDTFDTNGLLVNAAYDRLGQLTGFVRGGGLSDSNGNGILDTLSNVTRNQTWTLDGQGNWSSVASTVPTPPVTQTRGHNAQNQITSVSGGGPTPAYDNNGNLLTDEFGRAYVYDAWNRLVFVGGVALPMSYEHDALGRRIEETQVPPLPAPPVTTHVYFSDDWQVLEERVGTSPHASVQYIWSNVYVDALVFRDRDTNGNPGDGMEERLYVQQDANFNVTAVTDLFGTVVERYVYDAYGSWSAYDVNWFIRGASSYGWRYLHQGNRFDVNTGQYHVRRRELSPTMGRFLQRDPIEYDGGDTNLYRYVGNSPTNYTDPKGLELPSPTYRIAPSGPSNTASVVNWNERPGFWEGLIPIWGSVRNAAYHFNQGEWGWGLAYSGLAVLDVALVKSLVQGGIKLIGRGLGWLFGKGG